MLCGKGASVDKVDIAASSMPKTNDHESSVERGEIAQNISISSMQRAKLGASPGICEAERDGESLFHSSLIGEMSRGEQGKQETWKRERTPFTLAYYLVMYYPNDQVHLGDIPPTVAVFHAPKRFFSGPN